LISKSAGGIGLSAHNIRAKGTYIKGKGGWGKGTYIKGEGWGRRGGDRGRALRPQSGPPVSRLTYVSSCILGTAVHRDPWHFKRPGSHAARVRQYSQVGVWGHRLRRLTD